MKSGQEFRLVAADSQKTFLGNLVNCLQEHPSEGEAPDEDEEKEDKDNAKKDFFGQDIHLTARAFKEFIEFEQVKNLCHVWY